MKKIIEYLRIFLLLVLSIILVKGKLFVEGGLIALLPLFLLMKLRLKNLELRIKNLESNQE